MSRYGTGVLDTLSVGSEIEPLVKKVLLEKLIQYGGPAHNLHSDRAIAQREGFPDVVAWGMLTVDYVSELLGAAYGLGWSCGGRLSVRLAKPVFAGDIITVHARLQAREPTPDGEKHTFEVWAESPRGDLVLKGEASAIVRRPS